MRARRYDGPLATAGGCFLLLLAVIFAAAVMAFGLAQVI